MPVKYSFRDRIRYRVDKLITRSPLSQILVLVILSFLIVIIGTIAISGVMPDDLLLDGENSSIVYRMWWSFTRLVDQGTFIGDSTSFSVALTGVLVTMGGILIFSMLIGILSSKIGEKLDELKRGKSPVVEEDHTIIVGEGDKLFEVIRELIEAFSGMQDDTLTVFSPVPKEEMEETLKERIPDCGTTSVVCRTGSPTDMDALRKMGFDRAKRFLILGNRDEEIVKTLLAVWSLSSSRPLNAVCEIQDRRLVEIIEMAYRGVLWVPVNEIVMRLIVQVCRQPGLSSVYSEILSFSGNEFYFIDALGTEGITFAEGCFMVQNGIAVGIRRGKRTMINPDPRLKMEEGDRFIVLADCRDSCHLDASGAEEGRGITASRTGPARAAPEKILILSGENRKVGFILDLLDSYVEEGSAITVAGSLSENEALSFMPDIGFMTCSAVSYRQVDRTSYSEMKKLDPMEYDSILVLSGQGSVQDDESADSRCIVCLLILRKMIGNNPNKREPVIVSEIRNPRNRKLASAARIDDFVVSNEVTSMIMAQLSVQPGLWDVYFEIFDPQGCEIQMRLFSQYCDRGEMLTFMDLMKRGLRKREIVIGYLTRKEEKEDEISLNPSKDTVLTPGPADQIVVIAER